MATSITFDGNDLQTSNIITSEINHESSPSRNLPVYEIAHGNKSVIPFSSYPRKNIIVRGTVIDDSVALLDSRIDTLKGYFTGKDKNLDVGYGGSTRRYICTANDVRVARSEGLSYAYFDVELIATEPFGQDTSTTSAHSLNSRTTSPYSATISLTGSSPLQWPVVTIDYTSITSGTGASVTFGNDENGQAITITRDWATNDTLVIDCRTKIATVEGTEVDYTGAVPDFEDGNSDFTLSDTFSARTFDIDIDYYKRYL